MPLTTHNTSLFCGWQLIRLAGRQGRSATGSSAPRDARARPRDSPVPDRLSWAGCKGERRQTRSAVITRSLRVEFVLPIEEHDER